MIIYSKYLAKCAYSLNSPIRFRVPPWGLAKIGKSPFLLVYAPNNTPSLGLCCFLAESKANAGRLLPPNPRSRDALHTICVPFAKMEKCHDLNHFGWWTPFSILKHIFYVFGKGRSFANIRGIHKHLMDWMSESTTTAAPAYMSS